MRIACALSLCCLLLAMGCVSEQAFTAKDIESPCTIVTAKEIANICGYDEAGADGSHPGGGNYARCNYVMGDNGSVVTVGYRAFTQARCYSYSECEGRGIEARNKFMPSLQTLQKKENLGMGDLSWYGEYHMPEFNDTWMGVTVRKGSSAIDIATDKNSSNGCYDEGKLERIAALAFSRVANKTG